MVKKLFKHEFLAYARVMSIVYIILLTVATANRIIQVFETDTTAYTIISVISGITYGISIFMAFFASFWMGIVRFHRNLFTAEGYLSFTLPVTPTQHILVKVVTAVCFSLITIIAALISGCIATAGELLAEIWKALIYLIKEAFEEHGIQTVLVGIGLAVLLLVGAFANTLLYNTFIAIGQLSKKNRILAAFGAYFVFYIISQVVVTVIGIGLSELAFNGVLDRIVMWIDRNPYTATHIGIWGGIMLTSLFGYIEFIVTKTIITKKLNLE